MGNHAEALSKGNIWRFNLLILIVLGTHELPFTRLLKAVDDLIDSGVINDKVIVQGGHTPYQSKNMEINKFVSYEEMDRLYDDADLIITHGGTGSIISGIKKGKTLIAVARLHKYGEHNDDHQIELINEFVKLGYILEWQDGEALTTILDKAKTFKPQPFVSARTNIVNMIRDFIDKQV